MQFYRNFIKSENNFIKFKFSDAVPTNVGG